MELNVIREELIISNRFDLDAIVHDNTLNEIGDLCEQISHQYRSLAICKLLIDGDTDGFYHDLIRSAKTRIYYLSRCHNENYLIANSYMVGSRSEPFFDALVANQFGLAAEIASLALKEWSPDDEYEDDFYYTHFLHRYILFDPEMENDLKVIFENFEKSLKGTANARLKVCEVLLTKDQQAFDVSFDKLLNERKVQIEQEQLTALGEEMTFQTERHIFIEGLALLRIAENAGLPTQKEYLYCPSLARLPIKMPFPDNGYPKR